ADIEVGDLPDDRCFPKVALESVGLVYQAAIGAVGMGGEFRHCRQELVAGRGSVGLQQRRFQRRGGENLQVALAYLGLGVFAGDPLAFFRSADRALDGSAGLRENRLITGTAAAADRPAAAMEQAQFDATAAADLDQRDLGLIEFPSRGQITPILVAVGITQHYFLGPAAALEEAPVFTQSEQRIHHAAAIAEIGNRLEQRNDIYVQFTFARPQQACFLEKQRYFQNIGDAVGLGDDIVGHGFLAVPLL